jgi:gamma-glutamyl-gamma-aminobutyrate hydrolase PuuD
LQLDIPVVGILTMPTNPNWKSKTFNFDHYSWEHNVNFIHYGGTFAAVLEYDLDDELLYHYLDGLNGVYFTGGPLDLIDPESLEQHTYYKTAKKIFNYAKKEYDEGRYFPIFAICQGFEIIHLLENGDDPKKTFSEVIMYATSRRVNWSDPDPKQDTRMMADFPEDLVEKMAGRKYALHAHNYVIHTDTYIENESLSSFYNIIATDTYVDKHHNTSLA